MYCEYANRIIAPCIWSIAPSLELLDPIPPIGSDCVIYGTNFGSIAQNINLQIRDMRVNVCNAIVSLLTAAGYVLI